MGFGYSGIWGPFCSGKTGIHNYVPAPEVRNLVTKDEMENVHD